MEKILLGSMTTINDDGTESETPLFGYAAVTAEELEVIFSNLTSL